jgi:hypothetical protein
METQTPSIVFDHWFLLLTSDLSLPTFDCELGEFAEISYSADLHDLLISSSNTPFSEEGGQIIHGDSAALPK